MLAELLVQVISNPTTGVVLSLLLIFQWYNQYAKEQSVKNNLLAMKRIIGFTTKEDTTISENTALEEILDATLATIGARPPFRDEGKKVLTSVVEKFKNVSIRKMKRAANNVEILKKSPF